MLYVSHPTYLKMTEGSEWFIKVPIHQSCLLYRFLVFSQVFSSHFSMRVQKPIVCSGCQRYLHGKSAYLHHSCQLNGIFTHPPLYHFHYCLMFSGQIRFNKGKPQPAWIFRNSIAVFLLPPPQRDANGRRRMPTPFPTQKVQWPRPAAVGVHLPFLFE